ncbi:hypothetical protein ACLKA7_001245 [Drosophila subpalustris]
MDGYISDASSLTRDLKKLWQAGDLEVTSDLASDEEDANPTVAASAALLLRLAGGGADIVLIQEPWMVGGKISGLGSADYKLFVTNAQAVSLELRPPPIRLLSSYMAYDQEGPIPEDIARSLVSDCARTKSAYNRCDAKLQEWGSSNVNTRDIEGAFNNVFPEAITEALTDLGIEGRLVGLINQLLTSRAVTSTLGSSTLTRDEWTSATQGQEGALSFYTDGSKLNNQNSLVGRVARQTCPHIEKARSNALCNLSRGDCSLVIRSLTGHWLIGIHAQRLNSPYNDFCRSCGDEEEEESPEHFFCFCPALSSRRFRFLGKPFLDGLGDLASLSPRKIAQFVQSSNWTPF